MTNITTQQFRPVLTAGLSLIAVVLYASGAQAHDGVDHEPDAVNAFSHAPLGVMGDHTHSEGEWMLSYRFKSMEMSGNRDGDNSLSDNAIATTVPNRFFGTPGQPATLRIVPDEMSMDMHMVGAMYAPSDIVTLMVMGMYMEKEMTLTTYAGGAGTTIRGQFVTRTSGWGDVSAAALVRLQKGEGHQVHANFGLSLPTGSITEKGQILTPAGGTPTVRLPYAMQLGSGTYDLKPGLTYTGIDANWGWGTQWQSVLRTGENDQGYTLGDRHELNGWVAYQFQPWISVSGRLSGRWDGKIDGIDSQIVGPVQTADPENYGGARIEASLGVNLVAQEGALRGHRLAIEFGAPVYQNLNGPQMETDYWLMLGWQKAF